MCQFMPPVLAHDWHTIPIITPVGTGGLSARSRQKLIPGNFYRRFFVPNPVTRWRFSNTFAPFLPPFFILERERGAVGFESLAITFFFFEIFLLSGDFFLAPSFEAEFIRIFLSLTSRTTLFDGS